MKHSIFMAFVMNIGILSFFSVVRIDIIYSSDTCADAWIEKEVCQFVTVVKRSISLYIEV